MKIATHLVLAFMFVVQTLMFVGCTQHIKVFECKLDCADKSKMQCRAAVSGSELDFK